MKQLLSSTDQPAVALDNELNGSIEVLLNQRLTEQSPYRFYFKEITYQYAEGTLTLHGCLPTFYLKQVLQTLLRDVEGVTQIDNRVDVVSSDGLSSVREQ